MKKGKKFIKLILLILVIGLIVSFFVSNSARPIEYRTFKVKRGDIETKISGSGTIAASKARKEHAKVAAEITDVYFYEGDTVKIGDVIMKLDSSTFESNITSQKIAIEQSKLSKETIEKQINDLKIVANADGYINGLTISEGSYVTTSSPVCDIVRNSTYEIVLQYVYNPNNLISVGNSATLTVLNNYALLSGTVTKVSDMRKVIDGNAQVVDVTIEVQTEGYSLVGVEAIGEVNNGVVSVLSVNKSSFSLVKLNTVRAKSTGTVKTLAVSEGMYVKQGDVVAVLENNDLSTSLQNVNLSIQNQYNQLSNSNDQMDNYEIIAKLDGVITVQPFEPGDLISAGTLLATVSNKEKMEFKIPVDELDVAKIDYDNVVEVSIDALPETKYKPLEGKITLIPLEGTTTSGITDYYVTIEIEGRDDIRISMSANADIIVSSVKDVLCIPIDALISEDEKNYVEILDLGEDGKQIVTKKEVMIGASDTTYVEVKEGLIEGENVIIPTASTFHAPSASSMMERRAE